MAQKKEEKKKPEDSWFHHLTGEEPGELMGFIVVYLLVVNPFIILGLAGIGALVYMAVK